MIAALTSKHDARPLVLLVSRFHVVILFMFAGPVTLLEFSKDETTKKEGETVLHNEAAFEKIIAAGHIVREVEAGRSRYKTLFSWEDALKASKRQGGSFLELISTAGL